MKRNTGTDPVSPWLPRTKGWRVSWGPRPPSTWPGGCHLLCLSWGLLLPGTGREGAGTWWQDMFQQGLLKIVEAGARTGQCQWAMGDSNFCRRRRRSSAASGSPSSGSSSVPIDSGAGDREVRSGTHRSPLPHLFRLTTTTWRLFRFRGWWRDSWGRCGSLRAGDAGGGGSSSNCRGSLLSGGD